MSSQQIIDYRQSVDPICALLSVTLAVHTSCEQYGIFLDFELLRRELEYCAIKKYREEGFDVEAHMSDSENDEGSLGIGRGFHPQDFDDALVKKMENKANGNLCFFKIMVDRIGDNHDKTSLRNYRDENKHVIIEYRQIMDHCMYVVHMVDEGNNYYFLCRDTITGRDQYPRVPGQQNHELYKISVKVKRCISVQQRQQRTMDYYARANAQNM